LILTIIHDGLRENSFQKNFCGFDKYSNTSFEHRRQWIVNRVKFLSSVFNIQICSYAIMSNQYHLVLKVNDTNDWSIHQVLIHWQSLCKLPFLCQKFIDKEPMCKAELEMVYLLTKQKHRTVACMPKA
jgi:hypothetical protein